MSDNHYLHSCLVVDQKKRGRPKKQPLKRKNTEKANEGNSNNNKKIKKNPKEIQLEGEEVANEVEQIGEEIFEEHVGEHEEQFGEEIVEEIVEEHVGEHVGEHEGQPGDEEEEAEIIEVGADREQYSEDRDEDDYIPRNNNNNNNNQSSQTSSDLPEEKPLSSSKSDFKLLQNKPMVTTPKQPPLKEQVREAIEKKDFEEVQRLTEILLKQLDNEKARSLRIQKMSDDNIRKLQSSSLNFQREMFQRDTLIQQLSRERDELKMSFMRAGRPMGGLPSNALIPLPSLPPRVTAIPSNAPPVSRPIPFKPTPTHVPTNRPPQSTGRSYDTLQQQQRQSSYSQPIPSRSSGQYHQQQQQQQQRGYPPQQQSNSYSSSYSNNNSSYNYQVQQQQQYGYRR